MFQTLKWEISYFCYTFTYLINSFCYALTYLISSIFHGIILKCFELLPNIINFFLGPAFDMSLDAALYYKIETPV